MRRVDDAEATNTPIALVFSIPDYLPKAHTGISDGGNAESSQSLRFDFPTEIQTVGETSMLLYREGELIQEIPCHVSWDWDLGCVWPDLKTPIQFEEGVAYTAVLPENSVCSLYREDIWNQEQTISFVGGYQEPAPEISCIWCSLWYERLGDTLGEVRFGFGQEVALSEDPSVQLWTADMGSLLKEVVPTLETSESMWILVADFGGYPLDGLASGFIIVVPEGTLVTPSGEAANSRSEVRIDESNSVASMRQDSAVVNVSGNHLTIRSIPQGEQVCVYSADGVLEAMSARAADTLEVRLANGVHILRIGNKAYKIKI
ncbi:MAG: hypothetical protein LUD17_00055 [Bacteroidales bacterium]|nr:hypothetical protein [Bacteroidales bacterium]